MELPKYKSKVTQNENHEEDTIFLEIPDSDAVSSLPSSPMKSNMRGLGETVEFTNSLPPPTATATEESKMNNCVEDLQSMSTSLELLCSAKQGSPLTLIVDGLDQDTLQLAKEGDVDHVVPNMQTKEDFPIESVVHSQDVGESIVDVVADSEDHTGQTTLVNLKQVSPQPTRETNAQNKDKISDLSTSSVDAEENSAVSDQQSAPAVEELSNPTEVQEQNAMSKSPTLLSTPKIKLPTKEESRDIESPLKSSGSAPTKQDKEVVMAELKAMKIASVQARNAALEAEIAAKRSELEAIKNELVHPAGETVKKHIRLLHDYNDIRDIGQGLIGMIADNRGLRIRDLYPEFGLDPKD
ncbi:hypothetical protein B7463_g3104, partial [Scytalidium lignicola]